ncbi:MAG: metal-binding protein [Saprospiraceae bacterium]|nr:metal-binding protein [Pyrinomonadaceae bacterium]
MPSGKTHDAITILLAPVAAAICYVSTQSVSITVALTAAFLFGGLMFGPDLDTFSKQYSRWSVLRILWFPYRSCFKHRSRWSHGLIFGTLFRVIYFMGVLSVAVFIGLFAAAAYFGGTLPDLQSFAETWQKLGNYTRANFGADVLAAVFAGMWTGAASHTFTDMAGSYVKTGRVTEFL